MTRLLATLVFVVVVANAAFARSVRAGCTVSVNNNLGDPQTLVLRPGQNYGNDAFFYPTEDDNIIFAEGEVAVLACPGGTLQISGSNKGVESAEATCTGGQFEILGSTVSFSSIYCSRDPFHTARYTGASCLGDKREIEIGFELEDGWFIRVIEICFDDVLQNSLYSSFNVTKGIEGYQSGYPRPGFIEDDFYDVGTERVDDLYGRDSERATINALVGLSSGSTKYISSSDDFFLSRGHMTAKADFVFGAQHRATFHFVNVAPQWQTFNGANWNTLEQDVRAHVGSIDVDHVVYTGTHGISTLPHESTGEEIELYIYVDGEKKGLPVPAYYWKVLYEPVTKTGVAFVGVNNPYIDQPAKLCNDICSQYDWVHWDQTDKTKGFSYCCDVNELKQVIPEIPDIEITGILA